MQLHATIEDSTHLRLIRPLDMAVGSLVVLEIVDTTEDEIFLESSAVILDSAYGADEPDYSESGTPIEN